VRALILIAALAIGTLPALADGTGGPGGGAGGGNGSSAGSGSARPPEPMKSPAEKLAAARDAFRRGEYAKAIDPLNALLYPDVKLARQRDIVETRILLGVCLFETGDRKGAAREFEAALQQDGTQRLDENLFSAEVRDYFDETKRAKEARDRAAEDARAAAEAREKARKLIADLRVIEQRPFWVNLMPFGAGQFQNGDTKKGIFFAATEGLAAGTSITIFLYLVNKYGYGGQVPGDDAADVRRLQQIAIGADIVFYGVAFWGVIDAIRHHKKNVVLDPSSIDPDLLAPDQKTKRKPKNGDKPSSFYIHPIPIPDGAGAAITWEFE
jgi:tetratricopeptide (TPR) repeat protein